MAGGGLMQLVAFGAVEKYLTNNNNNKITFFGCHSIYKNRLNYEHIIKKNKDKYNYKLIFNTIYKKIDY